MDIFFSGSWQEDLAVPEKPVITFSLPSANAISLENLLRLYHYTGNNNYLERAEKQVYFLIGWFQEHGYLSGDTLIALDMFFNKPIEIISFNSRELTNSDSSEKYLRTTFLPQAVFLQVNVNTINDIKSLPLIEQRLKAQDNQDWFDGTSFICKNFTCSLPLKTGTEIDQYLNNKK
ncbi:MAG: hypothetical protein ACFFB5_22835 [Promethearchaeota archaeon]